MTVSDKLERFEFIRYRVRKTNFLTWAGLRHSIPSHLKFDVSVNSIKTTPCLTINDSTFDVNE